MIRTEGSNHNNHLFTNGPPGTSIEQNWLNSVQEEICYVIEQAGYTVQTTETDTHTQLYNALITLMLLNLTLENHVGDLTITPQADNAYDLTIGTVANSWKDIDLLADTNVCMEAKDDFDIYARNDMLIFVANDLDIRAHGNDLLLRAFGADISISSDTGQVTISADTTLSLQGNLGGIELCSIMTPDSHKSRDIGEAGLAFDTMFADDFTNVADFFFMDNRKDKDGKIIEINDLEVINNIKSSDIYDEKTGFQLIDDNTLPDWLCDKDKKTGNKYLTPDNKPYLSLKTMISLCLGSIRKLSEKVENLEGKLNK